MYTRCWHPACCTGWDGRRSTAAALGRAGKARPGSVVDRPGAAPSTRRDAAAAAAAAAVPDGAGEQCSRVEGAVEDGEVPDPVADGGDDAA